VAGLRDFRFVAHGAVSPRLPLFARSDSRTDVTAPGVEQQHVTNRRADGPALHPGRRGHLGASAASLAMRGQRSSRGGRFRGSGSSGTDHSFLRTER
jgi:hypothetical protein